MSASANAIYIIWHTEVRSHVSEQTSNLPTQRINVYNNKFSSIYSRGYLGYNRIAVVVRMRKSIFLNSVI